MPKSKISDSTNRVRELFECALEIPSGQTQDAYLDAECGTDSVLRSEVQSLLRVHSQSDDFLSQTVVGDAISSLESVIGSHIDRYRILERIGAGGFGEVYRAEQTTPIHREVALKIIKPGMDSREVIKRFEAERQALALLDHPHIAKVHDAGTTASGRPYFVMELACGLPITRFCDEERFSISDRLRLFQKVCRGVQHAHQKGIIHRDLKPSNIVVTRDGAETEPIPKIIDFGIAKSLQGKLTDATLVSRQATLMGTPAYMSPEQINLGSENLDTRSDIYSLGVILYELLAGTRPIETDEANGANFSEAQRLVCEVEPPRPSVRVKTLGESQETVARLRVTEPLTLSRTLRHDLDWIVMKAIEKDRARRYQGAGELADDIGRYLLLQPVLAGPPTQSYRLGKFVRRHRAGVLATSVAVIALIGGLTASLIGFRQAVAQQKITDQARTRAQEMINYIMEDLHPQLRELGRLESLIGSTGAAVRYFEQLPPELQDRETRRAYARALHLFVRGFFYPVHSNAADNRTLNAALEKARVLWPIVAAENPDDGEAAARADELLHFWDRNLSPAEDRASLEDLDRRFPENQSVQLYLAFRERQNTFYAGTRLSIEEAITQGIAGLKRIDRFLAINPKDPDWRLEKAKLLCGLGCAYQSAGSPEKMVQCLDQALSEVDSLLQDDPMNLEHLFLAARLSSIYIWLQINSGKSPEKQIQNTLERYQTLASFDPGNELFLAGEAGARWARAHYLWKTGHSGKAVAACDLALTRFAGDPPTTATLSDALGQLTKLAGYIEAEMGNLEGTRRRLDKLRAEDPWTEAMDESYEKSERKWILLMNQAFLVSLVADWAELERLGRAMLAMEIEITAVTGSNDQTEKERTRQVRLAIANTFLGEALFQQDRFKEAATALNKAFTHFQTTRVVAPYFGFGEWNVCPAAVHLSYARLHLGNSSGVIAPLEWAFTVSEEMLSRPEHWRFTLCSADWAWQLAQALNPGDQDQVARRNELLKLGRERLIQAFVDQPLPVSKMLEILNQYNPVRSAESAWRLAQLLDPATPEDVDQRTTLLTLAADWLDRAATEGTLKPEHQELRTRIEAQLAPPIL